MRCENCGQEFNGKFCHHCGSAAPWDTPDGSPFSGAASNNSLHTERILQSYQPESYEPETYVPENYTPTPSSSPEVTTEKPNLHKKKITHSDSRASNPSVSSSVSTSHRVSEPSNTWHTSTPSFSNSRSNIGRHSSRKKSKVTPIVIVLIIIIFAAIPTIFDTLEGYIDSINPIITTDWDIPFEAETDEAEIILSEEEQQLIDQLENPTVPVEIYDTVLTAGNYVVGVDIPVGIYSGTVLSGEGDIYSESIYWNPYGISDIYSAESTEYPSFFENVYLPQDTILSVQRTLEVSLHSENAWVSSMIPRVQQVAGDVLELPEGNYVVGNDIPEGVYTIYATAGQGNVYLSCENWHGMGINDIMGSPSDDMYINQFQNVLMRHGDTLEVSGYELKIQLIPVDPSNVSSLFPQ